MLDTFTDIWERLTANYKRLTFAVVGIAVSVWMLMAIFSIKSAFEDGLYIYLSDKYANTQSISCSIEVKDEREEVGLTEEELNQLNKSLPPYCEKVVYVASEDIACSSVGLNSQSMVLTGVSCGYIEAQKMEIIMGRSLSEEDFESGLPVIVISDVVAYNCFGSLDAAVNSVIGIKTKEDYYEFNVVGIYCDENMDVGGLTQELLSYESRVYCTSKYFDDMCKMTDRIYLRFIVTVNDVSHISEAVVDVEKMLYTYVDQEKAVVKVLGVDVLSEMSDVVDIVTMIFAIFLAVAFGTSGVSIMNIMMTNVRDRTGEIAIYKVLGKKNRSIAAECIVETLIICICGEVIGVLLGYVTAVVMQNMDFESATQKIMPDMSYIFEGSISFMPHASSLVIVSVYCMAVSLLFGYLPAKRATEISIIDALRV